MARNIPQSPFLRVQRHFPTQDAQALSIEIDRAYCDTAAKVNARTLGIYPVNNPIVTGDQWFFGGSSTKNQSLRQVYQITSYAAINHNIDFTNVQFFSVIRGIGFDGTNYFPIPYVSPVAVADGVGIFVSPTQIVLTSGAGSPALTSGIVILEWLSQT